MIPSIHYRVPLDIIHHRFTNTNLPAGGYTLDGYLPAAGQLMEVHQIVCCYVGTVAGLGMYMLAHGTGGEAYSIWHMLSGIVSGQTYQLTGKWFFNSYWRPAIYADPCTAGDDLYLMYHGILWNSWEV